MEWLESVKASDDACLRALAKDADGELEAALNGGRSIAERFHFKRTLLHIAAELGSLRCAETLLRRGGNIEALDECGHSALISAISYRRPAIAALFLEHGARIQYEFTPADDEGKRAKKADEYRKMFVEAQKQFAAKIRFDVPDVTDQMVQQAVEITFRTHDIHALDFCGDLESLRLLVERYGSNPNRHDGGGEWPLKSFARQGDVAAIQFLLAHGADPNFTSTGDTALHAAVGANAYECAEILLNAGANVNQQDVDGWAPLFGVSTDKMLDLLLKYGADPTVQDLCGFTASCHVKDPAVKTRLVELEKEILRRRGTD
jgi:ankyrin repeat protein